MKIIITGDSWGEGEWDNHSVSHGGLGAYLSGDQHTVINVSKLASSNMAALSRLQTALEDHTDAECIIWFQTDPMRELRDDVEEIPLDSIMPESAGFTLYHDRTITNLEAGKTKLTVGQIINNRQLHYRVKVDHIVGEILEADKLLLLYWRTYSETTGVDNFMSSRSLGFRNRIKDSLQKNNLKALNTVAKIVSRNLEFLNHSYNYANNLGRTIYCIGGLSKLKLDLIANYENLVPVIPSVLEMIYPEYQHADIVSSNSGWRQELMSVVTLDKESVDYFYQQYTLERTMVVACQEYFYPDGTHPNRKAHYKIYEKLKEEIPGL